MLPQSKTGGDSDRFAFHVSMVRNNQHKTLAVCRAEDARERLAIIETCTVDDGAPDPDDLEVSELQRRLAREGSVESLVLPETVRHSGDEDSRSSLWGLMSTLRTDSAVETSSSGRRSPHSDIDDGFSPQFHMPFPRRHVDATAEFADGDDVPSPNAERRLLGGLTVLKRRNSCTVDTALLQFPTQLSTPATEGLSLLGFSSLEPGAATQAPSASAVASAPPAGAEGDEADMRMLEGRIAAEMATVLGDEDAAGALEELLSLAKAPTSDSEEPPRAAAEDSHSAPRRRFVPLPPPWARDEQEKEPEQEAAISEEQTLPPMEQTLPPSNSVLEEEPLNRTGGFSISHSSRCGPVKRLLSPSATFSSPNQTPVISKMGGVAFQMLLPRAARTFDALRDEWAGVGEARSHPVRELDMEEQREQRRREAESEHQRMCAGLAASAALPFKDRGVALRMLLAEAARLHERAFNRLLAAAEAALPALPEAVEKGDQRAAGAQPATPCLRTASPASARSAASAAGFLLTPPAAWEAIMAHAERDLHSCGFQVVQRTLSCMSIFSTRGGATREYGENEHERRRRQEGRMEILAQLRAQGRLFLDETACAAAVARHNNPLCVAVQAALQRTEWDEAADRREVAEAEFDAWQLLLRRERNALAELTADADDSAAQRWASSHIVSPSALTGRRGAATAFPSAFPSAPDANDAHRADADAPTAVVAVDPQ